MVLKRNFPRAPPFYTIRLATLADVPRTAFVGLAGFRHSQIFEFERPYYEQHPKDAFDSFCEMFRDLILHPNTVALVVEDEYERNEDDYEPSVQWNTFFEGKKPQGRVIVGISCWSFEGGSKRPHQFNNPTGKTPGSPMLTFSIDNEFTGLFASERRDEIIDRTHRVDEAVDAANKNYFEGCNLLTKIVIHPAYWRRGHGTTLLNWGKRLADMDGVNQGTLPSKMGEKIAFVEGFDHIGDIHVDGDDLSPEGIDIAVGKYTSKQRPQN